MEESLEEIDKNSGKTYKVSLKTYKIRGKTYKNFRKTYRSLGETGVFFKLCHSPSGPRGPEGENF